MDQMMKLSIMWVKYPAPLDSFITTSKHRYIPTRCLNEQGRVILNDLSAGIHEFFPFTLFLGHSHISVVDNNELGHHFYSAQLQHLLQCSAKLERADLWHILKSVYCMSGYYGRWRLSYLKGYCNYPGYFDSERVVVDLEEWTLSWWMKFRQTHSQRLRSAAHPLHFVSYLISMFWFI